MKKTFREYHILRALNAYDFHNAPLDVHLSKYFRENRAIGSKDRKEIGEAIYAMIRWLALIDHFCEEQRDWESRYHAYRKLSIKKCLTNSSIPPHIRVSCPKILFTPLRSHFGEEKALELCQVNNTRAPTTIRVNVLKTNRQTLLSSWKDSFSATPTKHSVWGVQFEDRHNFSTFESFKQGHFEVQDEASQLIANLVEAKPGDQVLDYCAGAGGKTLAFAHKLQGRGQIYLHDIRALPLTKAKRRLKRAGIENAQILQSHSSNLENLKGKMDWILLDVPCSGSGTLRRNPDLKWKFTPELLKRLIAEQRKIFTEALPFLGPKGKIVYATCSILPEENEEQCSHFQETYGFDLCGKPFRSLPTEGGMDGFYGVTLTRSS
ncbi:MAG: Ribosomal RNA small subunit methyltransferase B [Chlamydiae bacterium]|nr:Ribosomal RNA small subunit methyltransferase B [Chlamydiota bacterium]